MSFTGIQVAMRKAERNENYRRRLEAIAKLPEEEQKAAFEELAEEEKSFDPTILVETLLATAIEVGCRILIGG